MPTRYSVTATALNLRIGPSTTSSVLAVLRQGQTCIASGPVTADWLPVAMGTQLGFVALEYVKPVTAGDAVTGPQSAESPLDTPPSKLDEPAQQTPTLRGKGLLLGSVGPRCQNQRDDVETVQRLLNCSASQGVFALTDNPLRCDGAFGNKTLEAIIAFRQAALGEGAPQGLIEADGPAIFRLCSSLPAEIDVTLLRLLYLRAAESDLASLASPLTQSMSSRQIVTPMRQAHFLAQVGHESGELRFRTELASGAAYEGRRDLGNTQTGDGIRFKGRGLIQLTGRANYGEYGRSIGREDDILAHPEQIADDIALSIDVAAWYWARHTLNVLADRDDLIAITTKINGRTNGLEDRRRLLVRAKALLGS